MGGAITSGEIKLLRSKPDSAGTMGVSAGPPGMTMLTVTPVPANSLACPADIASSAALHGPYGWNPARSMVKKLVVTLMIRPQLWAVRCGIATRVMFHAPEKF